MKRLLSRLQNRLPARPRAPLNLLYEGDSNFRRLYTEGLTKTGTPDVIIDGYPKRFVRFYNTAQYFLATRRVDGGVLECGCWRGLSMFIFASLQREISPQFAGAGFTVVDDYGSGHFPGARRAVEEFASREQLPFVGLSSGQAVLWK